MRVNHGACCAVRARSHACVWWRQQRLPLTCGAAPRDGIHSKELRDAVATDKGKAGIFYRSCMDTETIEKLGATPLEPYLEAIDAIKTHEDLIKVIAMLQKINVAAYWDWQVMADPTEPTRYVFAILDAGLTLPEPKMYTDDSPEFSHIRQQYTKVVENVLMLTGLTATQAKAAAADAISVETAIAKHTLPSHQLRTAKAKHYTMAELNKMAPGLVTTRVPWTCCRAVRAAVCACRVLW